jgi:hypothetical protein
LLRDQQASLSIGINRGHQIACRISRRAGACLIGKLDGEQSVPMHGSARAAARGFTAAWQVKAVVAIMVTAKTTGTASALMTEFSWPPLWRESPTNAVIRITKMPNALPDLT